MPWDRSLDRTRRALRPRGQFPIRELRRLPPRRPAGAVRSHRARRARRQLRRLRARQRGDRPVLRRHRPHVQHAQRDDAVVRPGRRCADDVGRRARRRTSRSGPTCSAASSSDGHIHSQPFSRRAGARRNERVSRRVRGRSTADGGSPGRKIFASLSGAANFYNVICQVAGDDTIRFLGVPADAEGVTTVDDWDPLGMRGTVSRTLLMDDVVRSRSQRVAACGDLQPGGGALPMAVPVAVPELPRPDRRGARHHQGVPSRRVARPGGGRPARPSDEAGRLGADATAPSAGEGVAVPGGRRGNPRPERGRSRARVGRRHTP